MEIKNICKAGDCMDSLLRKKGFTLTEVLLATAVVGVIAALVLPAVVTHFNEEVLTQKLKRQVSSIQQALDVLVVNENKSDFSETMMYTLDAAPDYDETVGKFFKKYFKVSKYYGAYSGANKTKIQNECFGSEYYEYDEATKSKKDLDISRELVGACAKLKNGTSICLVPQMGQNPAHGVIDINGPKGPNVKGRDYIVLDPGMIALVSTSTKIKTPGSWNQESVENVVTEDKPNITPDPENPCEVGDYGKECCIYYNNKGSLSGKIKDECCNNPEFKPISTACATNDLLIHLNYYPTTSQDDCDWTDWKHDSCPQNPNIKGSGTSVKSKVTGAPVTLPTNPPPTVLWCDGKKGGTMSSATLGSAINSNNGTYFYSIRDISLLEASLIGLRHADCRYDHLTTGKTSDHASVTFTNGSHQIEFGGIKWTIEKG